jgi:hypothetical protein
MFLRPPLAGIDDGAGGFTQDGHTALRGNDREQRLHGLEKLWPLGACAKAARKVADSSSNSVLWVERHTAGQRAATSEDTRVKGRRKKPIKM